MDYYIVRIYRREKGDRDEIVGTVEEASSQERRAFRAPEELWRILSNAGEQAKREKEESARRRRNKANRQRIHS